jgi:AcrR family transcriptional regulator
MPHRPASPARPNRSEPVGSPDQPAGPRAELLTAAISYVAQHGFGQASLRQIAAGIGTSHRMLIYHFGSKQGLGSAIIDAIQTAQLAALRGLLDAEDVTPADAAARFWDLVTDNAMTFGPLFFELAANAMRGQDREAMAVLGVHMWLEPLAELWRRGGADAAQAPVLARIGLAVANGLLLDALLTGDREAVRAGMQMFAEHFGEQWGR